MVNEVLTQDIRVLSIVKEENRESRYFRIVTVYSINHIAP